jgi:hypothetical protein
VGGQLDYLGLAFRDVALDLTAVSEAGLRVTVGGPNVAGTLTLPGRRGFAGRPGTCNSTACKFVDGARLTDDAARPARRATSDPRSIPAIISRRAVELGRSAIRRRARDAHEARRRGQPEALEHGSPLQRDAKGEWRGPGGDWATSRGKLISTDVRHLEAAGLRRGHRREDRAAWISI